MWDFRDVVFSAEKDVRAFGVFGILGDNKREWTGTSGNVVRGSGEG